MSGSDRQGEPVSDVARWSATLPEEFLLCRDLGHSWRPAWARWVPELSAYERAMRCGRCRTERSQTLSAGGLVLSGQYAYADGYTAPRGSGSLTAEGRGLLRVESIARLIGADPGAAHESTDKPKRPGKD